MYKLLYFCMAGGILLFSVIVVNISPAINGLVASQTWSQASCKYYADEIKSQKDNNANDDILDPIKREKTRCERKQAMVGLEFAAFNCNLVCGFVCALLGFFLFFNIGDVGKIACFAGLGAGIVGFVLTFVYVIESGLVFDDYIGIGYPRIDSNGVWAEWDNGKYKCKYFKEKKPESFYIRYSDLGNKYFNYNKDIFFQENKYNKMGPCKYNPTNNVDFCKGISPNNVKYRYPNDPQQECDKLYYFESNRYNNYKVIYDRWLTTLILSCIIFILDIGLALFGFLINSGSKGTGI